MTDQEHMFFLIWMLLVKIFNIVHQSKEPAFPQTTCTIQRTARSTRRNIDIKIEISHFCFLSNIKELILYGHVTIGFKFFDKLTQAAHTFVGNPFIEIENGNSYVIF